MKHTDTTGPVIPPRLRPRIIGRRASGAPIISIAGGSEPPNQPPAPTPPNPPAPGPEKTFTQAELDRIIGQRVAETKQAEARALAEQLGCTVEEAKAKIKAADDAESAKLSEAEKREKAAAEKEAAAQAATAQAAQTALDSRITMELAKAGITGAYEDAVLLVRRRNIDPNSDAAAITAAVTDLKTAMPTMFGGPTPGTPPPAPGSSTPPPGRQHIPPARPGQEGLDEAKRRFGDKAKLPAAT